MKENKNKNRSILLSANIHSKNKAWSNLCKFYTNCPKIPLKKKHKSIKNCELFSLPLKRTLSNILLNLRQQKIIQTKRYRNITQSIANVHGLFAYLPKWTVWPCHCTARISIKSKFCENKTEFFDLKNEHSILLMFREDEHMITFLK